MSEQPINQDTTSKRVIEFERTEDGHISLVTSGTQMTLLEELHCVSAFIVSTCDKACQEEAIQQNNPDKTPEEIKLMLITEYLEELCESVMTIVDAENKPIVEEVNNESI